MPLPPDHPMLAVVAPPRVERFRELVGVEPDEPITADFSGWSKLVLLTTELAILFPRDHTQVEPLEREANGLRLVAPAGLVEVPWVVGSWDDPAVSAVPFLAVTHQPRNDPFADFDLGEWSTAMWRRHRRDFSTLRRRYWDAYATARELDPGFGPVCEWVWSVAHALSFDSIRVGGPNRDHITGT